MKILWVADLHIGVKRYGSITASGVHSRVLDTISAFAQVVDLAIKKDVKLVGICGDVFTNRNPANLERELFAKEVARLLGQGIDVLMIPGNHDTGGFSTNLSELEHLSPGHLTVVSSPTIFDFQGVHVACVPWLDKSNYQCKDNEQLTLLMIEKIEGLKSLLEDEENNFFMGHFTVDGGVVGSEKFFLMGGEETIPLKVLEDDRFEAVMLGHLHRHQRFGNSDIYYVGSLVKCDFSEKNDTKGVMISDNESGKWQHNFYEIPDRKFFEVIFEVTDTHINLPCFDFKDSIVKAKISYCLKNKHLVNVKEARDHLLSKGVHHIESIQTECFDEQIDRKNKIDLTATDEQMLEIFVTKVRNLEGDFAKEVMEEGKKILEVSWL